jgi:hypothetical protein
MRTSSISSMYWISLIFRTGSWLLGKVIHKLLPCRERRMQFKRAMM